MYSFYKHRQQTDVDLQEEGERKGRTKGERKEGRTYNQVEVHTCIILLIITKFK